MWPDPWFAAFTPEPLLATLRRHRLLAASTIRRPILFRCACARMVWELMPTDARNAVEIRERYADGRATTADLAASEVRTSLAAVTATQHAVNAAGLYAEEAAARSAAKALATQAAGPTASGFHTTQSWETTWNEAFAAARAVQADIVRDIFPPPDYTPHLDPNWLTSTVVALARQMDDSGDFSPVPILADALQDAGCDDETVLRCCRTPGNVHVRGNWVVDGLLGRA